VKSIFITGTDTGVGKTAVSAHLCAYLSVRKHLDVGAMKPFETGLSKGPRDWTSCDATLLKEVSGSRDRLDEISPYTFEAPLAPEVAAKLENIIIDLDVVNETYQRLLIRHDVLIVEGAGGAFVPIKKDFFFADLMKAWSIPVLIVSRLGLGAINHTLLTNTYLQSKGVRVIGVILNDTEGAGDLACETNPEVLREYLDVPVLGVIPHEKKDPESTIDRKSLADTFSRCVDTETIMRALRLAP